jgi:benzil reductase ((S)-benzoin forming)
MKKIAIVSGSSKGIGRALVEALLFENYFVIGIARTNTIEAPNFTFIPCDLQHWERIADLDLQISEAEEIVLINNAGRIGEIVPFKETTFTDFKATMDLNLMAVMALCHKVLNLKLESQKLTIVNISSGAGRNTIPSWTPYCTSKAAVDHFSKNLQAEYADDTTVKIFSLAPGVVDTEMQKEIRSADPEKFPMHERFIHLHQDGELRNPEILAKDILAFLSNPPDEVITRIG